jgi:hypothetical protein
MCREIYCRIFGLNSHGALASDGCLSVTLEAGGSDEVLEGLGLPVRQVSELQIRGNGFRGKLATDAVSLSAEVVLTRTPGARKLVPTKAPKKLAPQKDNAKTEWGARLGSRVPPPASWQQTSHRLLQDPSVTAVIALRIQYVKNGQGH